MSIYSFAAMLLIMLLTNTIVYADDKPQLVHVGMVSPHIISLTVMAGRVEHGRQIPYDGQEGDEVEDHNHHRWVKRDGKFVGSLAGAEGSILHTLDILTGEKFNTEWADRVESYQITSEDDPAYADSVTPTAIHRKSKPTDLAVTVQQTMAANAYV